MKPGTSTSERGELAAGQATDAGVGDRLAADGAGPAVHADSGGIYGWRRVNAELTYGHGVIVRRKTVWKINAWASPSATATRYQIRR